MEPKFITIENGQVTVRPTKNGIWLTQNEIARLFEVFVPAVNANIRSILKNRVLREEAVCKDIDLLRVYNMEMITALAFRLKSGKAEQFRRWIIDQAVNPIVVWKLSNDDVTVS